MKNTKIMAVLVVSLIATLFSGAVSAAAMTNSSDFNNITANKTSIIAAPGVVTLDIKIYNTSVLLDSSNVNLFFDWGDGTAAVAANLIGGTPEYNVTLSHTYTSSGRYTVMLRNTSAVTDGMLSKSITTMTVPTDENCNPSGDTLRDTNLSFQKKYKTTLFKFRNRKN